MNKITMQPLEESETRLSEILDRAERGESILLSRNGRPVATVTPVTRTEENRSYNWLDQLIHLREQIRSKMEPVTTEEILSWIHEGRRF